MIELKIDHNLVVFSFCCKLMLNARIITATFLSIGQACNRTNFGIMYWNLNAHKTL